MGTACCALTRTAEHSLFPDRAGHRLGNLCHCRLQVVPLHRSAGVEYITGTGQGTGATGGARHGEIHSQSPIAGGTGVPPH